MSEEPRLGFWYLAERDPDRPAVVDPDGHRTSFGELYAGANQLAHGLRRLGLGVGDGIAFALPNHHAFYEYVLASEQIGLYHTPINYHLTGDEIAYILGDCEASVFIAHEQFRDESRAAAKKSGFQADRCFAIGTIPGFRSAGELKEGMPVTLPAERSLGQRMLYTSGTTGRPKGVRRPLTGQDPSDEAHQRRLFGQAFGLTPEEGVHLVCGPLYHAGPSVYSFGSFHVGHEQIMMEKWTPEGTLEQIERHRVTNSFMVPTMFRRLLSLPGEVKRRHDLSSISMIAHTAAPCPVPVKQGMMDWLGPVIWEVYGGTEGHATIAKPHRWLEKPGTVGRPIRGIEVIVIDDDGKPCPPGSVGTIYATPVKGMPFEYFKDAEKTQKARHGKFYTLGDMGYFDEDGYLFVTDRKIDMIISGGVNIYPREIENVLLTDPRVGDVAVFGVPDDDWGEQVKAVVEPAEGIEPSEALAQELIDICRERLAHFKCPRSVEFRAELPRYESGKLYKRRIRDEYWQGRTQRV